MKVGILGAGQLSRMLALAGIPLGIDFAFYAPQPTECVKHLGELFQAEYDDSHALQEFAQHVDVLTYENENIPTTALKQRQQTTALHPNTDALEAMQDRYLERQFLQRCDVPVSPYAVINNKDELQQAIQHLSLPVIVKKRTHSYDGKGQHVIKKPEDMVSIKDHDLNNCIVEKFLDFDREVSLIACRDLQGNMAFYDICQNIHKNGILRETRNQPNDPLLQQAQHHLEKIMNALNYVGICTVEFFEINQSLVANECAPRVHNTGHWTIEGAKTSQFENHLRCILGLKLGETTSLGHYCMHNVIGEFPAIKNLLHYPVHVHDYQKAPRANRKIGHVTHTELSKTDLLALERLVNHNT